MPRLIDYCIALPALAGGFALVGWVFNVAWLRSLIPGQTPMNPLTALTFLAAATGLWGAGKRRAPLTRTLGGLVALVGANGLVAYWRPGFLALDQWLFASKLAGNRMAPNTALSFLLIGAALVFLDTARGRLRPAQWLALACGSISWAAICGYTYKAEAMYDVVSFIPMAFNTAVAFVILALGVLAARPSAGLSEPFTQNNIGGVVARKLATALLVLPLALGWLRLHGQKLRLYDDSTGDAAMTVCLSLAGLWLVWWTARSIGKVETERLALERQQERFFNVSSDLLCVADFGGYFKILNGAWEKTLGTPSEELCSLPFFEFMHPDDHSATTGVIEAMAGGARIAEFENRFRHKDGTYRWLEWSAVAVPDEGLIYGAARDITDQKKAQEELATARDAALLAAKAKAEFLANMSHELRTPLNAVIGMSGILMESGLDEDQTQYASTVYTAGEALLAVINNILDFSKIDSGKLALEMIDFDLRELLEGALEILAVKAQGKGLELLLDMPPEAVSPLRGDPGRLRQIVLNLVGNAVKFTEKGEVVISVETRVVQGKVDCTLRVRDSGIGIPKEAQAKLFTPFTQADASVTRRFGGTGLGLTISLRLVEMMGGKIALDSEPGKGTTFTVDLSLEPGASPAPPQRAFSGEAALVVAGHPLGRAILQRQLRAFGLEVAVAQSTEEALPQLRAAAAVKKPFKLVIVEAGTPTTGGLTLAKKIKDDADLGGSKVILLGPMTERAEPAQLRAAGVLQRLIKPVKQASLLQSCARALEGVPSSPDAPVQAVAQHRSYRILVVEDNAANQTVAQLHLKKLGYSADLAGNGHEALEAVARQHYDLIFMDCHMPEMDGYTAAAEIRRREMTRFHVPIIAMTANALEGDRDRCLACGMNDYISKPIDPRRLADLLKRWDVALDRTVLAEMRELMQGESPALFKKIMGNLFRSCADRLGELRDAVRRADARAVEEAAHSLKGSAGTLGAVRLHALAERIEILGRAATLDAIPEALEDITGEVRSVQGAVEAELGSEPGQKLGALLD